MPATLRLRREPPIFEIHAGAFDVLVDGNRAGSIENHAAFEAPVEPGHHTLQVRAGRYSSRTVAFAAAGDEIIAFRCHSGRIWPILLASTVIPSVALKLRRE